MKINQFRGVNFFLSNFFEAPVTYDGIKYPSNESAFQAAKIPDNNTRDRKTGLMRADFAHMTPNIAKKNGKRVNLRTDWDNIKDSIMLEIVQSKFQQNKILADKLIKTKNLTLEEGTTWHDKYWGIDLATGKGQNKLGIILMQVRNELKIKQAKK